MKDSATVSPRAVARKCGEAFRGRKTEKNMKKTLRSFVLALFGTAVCAAAFSAVPKRAAAAGNDYDEKPDDYYSYVQKFTDEADVNKAFHAWYRENALGSAKAEQVVTDVTSEESHWAIEDGVLKRINDVKKNADTGKYETNQVAILTFTKEAYLNFELSVDYKRGTNGYWPVVGIRQVEEGKYYLDDGAGVFVQESGMVTLWGDQIVSGPHEIEALDGYDKKEWHNMQIHLRGNELKVSIDNRPWATKTVTEEFYETGYVSLCSVNNETEYRNFRIKALPEPEKAETKDFLPMEEAKTDDALSSLAGEVKPKGELFEREPERASVAPADSATSQKTGCKGSLGGGMFLFALPAAAFALKKRKI